MSRIGNTITGSRRDLRRALTSCQVAAVETQEAVDDAERHMRDVPGLAGNPKAVAALDTLRGIRDAAAQHLVDSEELIRHSTIVNPWDN